ncbi:MAG TPA: maleylpyruvate isomerase family mycothiol-dependent enzyme [Acidimicrobiales bacterium]|nr:maleylpyruvate isomerase family mycothiol-dependent enzyme [Acidimicrobiales bacterium]
MLSYSRYLESLGQEGALFSEASRQSPLASITTCPGWQTRDLVQHLAGVYRFWSIQLLAGDETMQTTVPTFMAHGDVNMEFDQIEFELTRQLSSASEDAPCWNWSGGDYTSGWVARRMALETAIHRIDAQLAGGDATPIDSDLSLDGIDERLEVHLRLDLRENPTVSLGGTICLICSDADSAWTISAERGRLRVRDGRGPASVALVGSASSLFQFVWNRADLNCFQVTGDRSVAVNWTRLPC